MRRVRGSTPCVRLYIFGCFSRGGFPGLSARFISGLAASYAREGLLLMEDGQICLRSTPFQDIRYPGMTHAYHGLSRAFSYIELESTKFAVDGPNELAFSISCFRGLSHADADADAVVGLLKVSSQTSR